MNVAIVGSRGFNDYLLMKGVILFKLRKLKKKVRDLNIISGGARGADSLAEKFASEYGLPIKVFIPEWDKKGSSAGFDRNKEIIKESDMVFAFWDGYSTGTMHSIGLAKTYQKALIVFDTTEKTEVTI